ncbi:cytochrome P450 [Entophlyctis helioformis]|nr:cytochrome P450 [Entophlyctis helioformis]
MGFIDSAVADLYAQAVTASGVPEPEFRHYSLLAVGSLVGAVVFYHLLAMVTAKKTYDKNAPPMVPHTIPFLGNAIAYGIDPVKFLQENQAKYGDCFTFLMMGRKMTFCLGTDGNHFVFNVPIANASAEAAYEKLTVPVFGDEVVYDVPNAVFMEQKKFVKDTFTTAAFHSYVPILIEETTAFLKEWTGDRGKVDLFKEMSELTIRTASHCLMGKEVRKQLHSNVAKLYHDLDAGLAPINVFFRWLPLPTYINRDRANRVLTNLFKEIVLARRANEDYNHADVMQSLMDAKYRDGSVMSDNAISHLMIATLMGGQHTSSTTSSWIFFELARRPDIIEALIREQSQVLTGKPDTPIDQLPNFTYEQLREFTLLDCVMKETLRIHPPIHTIMRKVEKPLNYKGMEIPVGHFLCGSQAVSQMDPARFPDPTKFDPTRFLSNTDEGSAEWTINGVDIAQKSARSHFLPFGAGRHRCIGEAFAYVQIKSIVALFLREMTYKLDVDPKTGLEHMPKLDYSSLVVVPELPRNIVYERRAKA